MSQNTQQPPLKVTQISGRGRALISTQPLNPGQIILRDSPLLLYSALPLPHKYCLNCFRSLPSNPTTLCPSNPSHTFCSHNCLTNSSHSTWACIKLTNLHNNPKFHQQNNDIQNQFQFLIAAYNVAVTKPDDFQLLLSLDAGCVDVGLAEFLHSVLSGFFGAGVPGFSVEMTGLLLGKDKVNAFGLMEGFSEGGVRSVRAYGIYPKASFFNHDCLPNACRFDYVDVAGEGNTDIVVRMIHGVPEGREVCLSYFPVNESFASRQKRLREDYGFVCECDRCKVEVNWSDDEGEVRDEGEEEGMEEDEDEDEGDQMVGSDEEGGGEEGESDFPHAYFFIRYMCNRDNCGGTLAPLPPTEDGTLSNIMECNVCGILKNADEDIAGDGGEGSSNIMDE